MNENIFRKVSLDRLSSPEQLDLTLNVTNVKMWMAITAILLLLSFTTVWAFQGSLPTTVSGSGVIVRKGGVLNIVSAGAGEIVELKVSVGSKVHVNQVLATIAQPSMKENIRATREMLSEAELNRERLRNLNSSGSKLQAAATAGQRAGLLRQITESESDAAMAAEQVQITEEIFKKGLVTRQQVLDDKQKLVRAKGHIEDLRAQLKQLDSQEYTQQVQPLQTDADAVAKIQSVQRSLVGLEENLKLAANVISPYNGEVVELKVYPGSAVTSGEPILAIQPDTNNLEVLVYVPSSQAKDVKVGMDSQISPSTVKREEYGYLTGAVSYVADYPSTQAALMRNFSNEALATAMSKAGPVTEIHLNLHPSKESASGYQWSSPKGPPVSLSAGTLCTADIVTKTQSPASLVFPILKSKAGVQ